jgi:nicotinamide phosphoribosyltransferase
MSILFNTDSYKVTQKLQYSPDAIYGMTHIIARGGMDEYISFGVDAIMQKTLKVPTKDEVKRAAKLYKAHFGTDEMFNYEGWMEIVDKGYFPIEVLSVPEGTKVKTGQAMATVRTTEPGFLWLLTWLETAFMRVWYTTTVATNTFNIKRTIKEFLDKTSDDSSGLNYKLQDFGCRGVSSYESAGLGGMADLVNFQGSDTVPAMEAAMEFYDANPDTLAFSIAASEHSTITSWGRDKEFEAYENMVDKFGDKVFACVSDSYNIWEAIKMWKRLEDKIKEKGGVLVVRPDSGDPVSTPVAVIEELMDEFGYTVNSKGYKVLPDYVRVIQGDGIDGDSIRQILERMQSRGLSAENIAFGMGGALLQGVGRDDLKFAVKLCATWDEDWNVKLICKDPITDSAKRSMAGLMINFEGKTRTYDDLTVYMMDKNKGDFEVAYSDGYMRRTYFDSIRERVESYL